MSAKIDLTRGVGGAGRTKIRFVRPDDDLAEILAVCADDPAIGFAPDIRHDPEVGLAMRLANAGRFADVAARLTSQDPPELMDVFDWYTTTLVAVCRDSGAVVGLVHLVPPPNIILDPQQPEVVSRVLIAVTKLAVVAVVPSRRGDGIGASLVKQARIAAAAARLGIMFGQFTESERLDRFYRARGFQILPAGAGVDASATAGRTVFFIDPDPAETMFVRKLQSDYPGPVVASPDQVAAFLPSYAGDIPSASEDVAGPVEPRSWWRRLGRWLFGGDDDAR